MHTTDVIQTATLHNLTINGLIFHAKNNLKSGSDISYSLQSSADDEDGWGITLHQFTKPAGMGSQIFGQFVPQGAKASLTKSQPGINNSLPATFASTAAKKKREHLTTDDCLDAE